MSFVMQDVPTVDRYALQLRNGLREAAKASLTELEDSINSMGFGWMDGYMEQILDRGNRAPIAELMKTPSRTQGTSKKTRANTAAAKDRTEKVKGLNARLALSPVTKLSTSTRMPLSPLQPRSLNAVQASPVLVASPKSKSDKPPAAKGKPKAKRGKAKKIETDENATPSTQPNDSVSSTEGSTSTRLGMEAENHKQSEVPGKSKSSRSKKVAKPVVETPVLAEPIVLDEPDGAIEEESLPLVADDEVLVSHTAGVNDGKDGPIVEEEEAVTVPAQAAVLANDSSIPASTKDESTDLAHASSALSDDQQLSSSATESQEAEHPKFSTKAVEVNAATVPIQEDHAAPAVPVRQVRSSWLSKALGTGTVPISGIAASNESAAALRKSYAAPAQQRQSVALDFTGLRKSLAPIGGLKRKSNEGVDDELEEEEEKRPEKLAKIATTQLPATSVESAVTQTLPTRTPAPVARPALPAKTPSFGFTPVASDSQTRAVEPSTTSQSDNHRSDIHKVTKALDELRERAAAKEAAKQKAAQLAASTGPVRVPQAKSTGTGFLRGLGSIGAGLLGLGGTSAEEEADRLAQELEAERMAEQELEKLLADAVRADTEFKEDERSQARDSAAATQSTAHGQSVQTVRPTAPETTHPVDDVAHVPDSPQEEEQMVEEQSVMDELMPEEIDPPQATEEQSTTPTGTPTRPHAIHVEAPPLHDRMEKHQHEHSVPLAHRKIVQQEQEIGEVEVETGPSLLDEAIYMTDDVDEEDEIEHIEQPQRSQPAQVDKGNGFHQTHRKMPSSTSSANLLQMSTASVATSAGFGQAQTMAAKALGVKPATGPVKSIALAAAAAKKEQLTSERKALMKDQAEQRKAELAKKKAEEDRIKADLERKAKIAEIEEKKRQRAELEKRKKEREEKAAAIAKEKAAREEREAQAARVKAAEEEAARKRKLAATLSKSQNGAAPSAKRIANPATQPPASKGKEPFRPTKQGPPNPLASSASGQKMGPTVFRTAPPPPTESQTSSITLVSQTQQQSVERKVLGPPSRPSAMAGPAQPMRQSTAVHQNAHANHASASSVLQQSRVALQTQLDEKAALVQSEDIVLPDIASEYSDSDDEDRSRDFQRPAWAESPELRAALQAQAHRDPDELFGPIKPLNMEELFKVHKGKFRARTSSANWARGDGLTRAEEIEYARRMGFKSNLGREVSGSGL